MKSRTLNTCCGGARCPLCRGVMMLKVLWFTWVQNSGENILYGSAHHKHRPQVQLVLWFISTINFYSASWLTMDEPAGMRMAGQFTQGGHCVGTSGGMSE